MKFFVKLNDYYYFYSALLPSLGNLIFLHPTVRALHGVGINVFGEIIFVMTEGVVGVKLTPASVARLTELAIHIFTVVTFGIRPLLG